VNRRRTVSLALALLLVSGTWSAASVAIDASPARAATLQVNSTGDAPDQDTADGVCDTGATVSGGGAECTLRAALEQANAMSGFDLVEFGVTGTITLGSPISSGVSGGSRSGGRGRPR